MCNSTIGFGSIYKSYDCLFLYSIPIPRAPNELYRATKLPKNGCVASDQITTGKISARDRNYDHCNDGRIL